MALDEPKETDIVTQTKGFKFVIDKGLASQFPRFSVVYQNGIIFKGLRVYAHGASYC